MSAPQPDSESDRDVADTEMAASGDNPALIASPQQALSQLAGSSWIRRARDVFKVVPTAQPSDSDTATRASSPFGLRYHPQSSTFEALSSGSAAVTQQPRPAVLAKEVILRQLTPPPNIEAAPAVLLSPVEQTSKKKRNRKQSSPTRRPVVIAPSRFKQALTHYPGAAQPLRSLQQAVERSSTTTAGKEPEDTRSCTDEEATTRGVKRVRTASHEELVETENVFVAKRTASTRAAAQRAKQSIANMSTHSGNVQISSDEEITCSHMVDPSKRLTPMRIAPVHQGPQGIRRASTKTPPVSTTPVQVSVAAASPARESSQEPAATTTRTLPIACPQAASGTPPPVSSQAEHESPSLQPRLELTRVHVQTRTPRQIRDQFIRDVRALAGFYAGYGTPQPVVDPMWADELESLIEGIMKTQVTPRPDVTSVMLMPPNSFPLKNADVPLSELELSAPDLALLITMEATAGMTPEALDKLLICDKDSLAEYLSRFAENECLMAPSDKRKQVATHPELMSRSGYPGCVEYNQKSVSWLKLRDTIRFDTHAQTVAEYVRWLQEKRRVGIHYSPCHQTGECENCLSMDKAAFENRQKKYTRECIETEPTAGNAAESKREPDKAGGGFLLHYLIANSARVWHWYEQIKQCKLKRARSVSGAIRTGKELRKRLLPKSARKRGEKPKAGAATRNNAGIKEVVKKAIKNNDPTLLLAPMPPREANEDRSNRPTPIDEPIRRATTWRKYEPRPAEFATTAEFRQHARRTFQIARLNLRKAQTDLMMAQINGESGEEIITRETSIQRLQQSLQEAHEQFDRAQALTLYEGGRISPARFRGSKTEPESGDRTVDPPTTSQVETGITQPTGSESESLVPFAVAMRRINQSQPVMGTINVSPADNVDDTQLRERTNADRFDDNSGLAHAEGGRKFNFVNRVDASAADEEDESNGELDLSHFTPFKHDAVLHDHAHTTTADNSSLISELADSDDLRILSETIAGDCGNLIKREVLFDAGQDMQAAQAEKSFSVPDYRLPSTSSIDPEVTQAAVAGTATGLTDAFADDSSSITEFSIPADTTERQTHATPSGDGASIYSGTTMALSPISHIASPSNPTLPQSTLATDRDITPAAISAQDQDGLEGLQLPPPTQRVGSAGILTSSTLRSIPVATATSTQNQGGLAGAQQSSSTQRVILPGIDQPITTALSIDSVTPLLYLRSPSQAAASAAINCGDVCVSPRSNDLVLPRSLTEPAAGAANYFVADTTTTTGYRYTGTTSAEVALAPRPAAYLSRASRVHPSDGPGGVALTINMPSDTDRTIFPLSELFQAMYLRVDRAPPRFQPAPQQGPPTGPSQGPNQKTQ